MERNTEEENYVENEEELRAAKPSGEFQLFVKLKFTLKINFQFFKLNMQIILNNFFFVFSKF